MKFLSLNDCFNWLLDAQIDDFIAIIGKNDIHQIFADVMDIAFDGGNQEFGLGAAFAFGPLH